jgi:hypothetical protein
VLSICIVGKAVPQTDSVEWQSEDELSDTEKSEILEVVEQAGLVFPRHVFTQTVANECTEVRVESESGRIENRVLYDLLFMKRVGAGQCPSSAMVVQWPEPSNLPANALVLVGSAVQERWRVSDGTDWYLDIRLGEGVPFADASAIVQSIRHDTYTFVLNLSPRLGLAPRVQTAPFEIELDHTTRVNVLEDWDDPALNGVAVYSLTTGGVASMHSIFAVRPGSVELLMFPSYSVP